MGGAAAHGAQHGMGLHSNIGTHLAFCAAACVPYSSGGSVCRHVKCTRFEPGGKQQGRGYRCIATMLTG